MKKILILLPMLMISNVMGASEIIKDCLRNPYAGYLYQQSIRQYLDPLGDFALLGLVQIRTQILKNIMLRNGLDSIDSPRSENVNWLKANCPYLITTDSQSDIYTVVSNAVYSSLQDFSSYNDECSDSAVQFSGRKAPFKSKQMINMFLQIIEEEKQKGIHPKIGQIHQWSLNTKKEFPMITRFPKLLLALANGSTSQYAMSGHEESLKDDIMSYENESIHIHELFRKSYTISKGDMYLTLLTIENVLSREWLNPYRSDLALTKKLTKISNYCGDSKQDSNEDRFGHWYHLFGIMLYGCIYGEGSAGTIGRIENAGGRFFDAAEEAQAFKKIRAFVFGSDRQEEVINKRGAVVGGKLCHTIRRRSKDDFEMNKDYLSPDYYLDLNEDFSKRINRDLKKIE